MKTTTTTMMMRMMMMMMMLVQHQRNSSRTLIETQRQTHCSIRVRLALFHSLVAQSLPALHPSPSSTSASPWRSCTTLAFAATASRIAHRATPCPCGERASLAALLCECACVCLSACVCASASFLRRARQARRCITGNWQTPLCCRCYCCCVLHSGKQQQQLKQLQ